MAKLTRRQWLGGLALGGVALGVGRCVLGGRPFSFPPRKAVTDVVELDPAFTGRPPNVVLINCDDLGYGDLGSYGGQAIKTPNLDEMAASGVRFTDFHACDSVCTPSRAGMLTGRYPKRMKLDFPLPARGTSLANKAAHELGFLTGRMGLMDMGSEEGAGGLNEFELTLGEVLRLRGYHTAMVGKWHLGDYSREPRYHPLNHGFDRYFGVPYSNDMTPFPLYRDREVLEANVGDQSKLTALYTDEAIQIVESNKGGPFFLYLAHTFPHRPLHASAPFANKSQGGLYGDAVEEIDHGFGRLVEALKKHDLLANTLILFTSDNGPWYDGSPGALRGRKGQSFEGGFRVPLLARWDGTIPRGKVCDELAVNLDFFPTLLALAGLRGPRDRVIDGVSMVDLLTHPEVARAAAREMYFYHQGELESMRAGAWKLIRNVNHYVWPMPVNQKLGKMSNHTTGPLPMLFDLKTDPGEAYNLADRWPDKVSSLSKSMADWEARMTQNPLGLT